VLSWVSGYGGYREQEWQSHRRTGRLSGSRRVLPNSDLYIRKESAKSYLGPTCFTKESDNTTVIVDTDLSQYRMSSFAFDDDAMTVVLTTAGVVLEEGGIGRVREMDLVCYK
jgi:hypothetical protein